MLNKGFRFFGSGGSSKKFQVSLQKAPWPDLFSKIGNLIIQFEKLCNIYFGRINQTNFCPSTNDVLEKHHETN